MADNVKGITIQIGGDVQPLNQALKGVSIESNKLQKSLEKVTKELKLDPANIDLIIKKEVLLNKEIENTYKQYDMLIDALESSEIQFKSGEITAEQLDVLVRAFEKTEEKIKDYEEQMQELSKMKVPLEEAYKPLEELYTKADELKEALKEATWEQNKFAGGTEKYIEAKKRVQELEQALKDNQKAILQEEKNIKKTKDTLIALNVERERSKTVIEEVQEEQRKANDETRNASPLVEALSGQYEKMLSRFDNMNMQETISKTVALVKDFVKEFTNLLNKFDEADSIKSTFAMTQESVEKSAKAFKEQEKDVSDTTATLRTYALRMDEINRQIREGNRQNKDTSKLQNQLNGYVRMTNDLYGKEVVLLNDQTGALKTTNKELGEMVTNFQKEKEGIQTQERLAELYKEFASVQRNIQETEQAIAEGRATQGTSYYQTLQDEQALLQQITDEITLQEEKLEGLGITAQETVQSLSDAEAEALLRVTEANGQIDEQSALRLEKYKQEHQESYNYIVGLIQEENRKYKELYDNRVKYAQKSDKEIELNFDQSLKERTRILQHNQQVINDYETNFMKALEYASNLQDAEDRRRWGAYLDSVKTFSEENAVQLAQIVDDIEEAGGEGADAFVDAWNDGMEKIPDGFEDALHKVEELAKSTAGRVKKSLTIKVSAKGDVTGYSGQVKITAMAQGGIVTQPTYALIGEAGTEAILPIDRLSDILRDAFSETKMPNQTNQMNVYVQDMTYGQREALFNEFNRWLARGY